MPETQSDVNWFNREANGLVPVLRIGPAFAPGGNRSISALLPHSTSEHMPAMSGLVNVLVLQRNEYLNRRALSGFTVDLNETAGFFRQILDGT